MLRNGDVSVIISAKSSVPEDKVRFIEEDEAHLDDLFQLEWEEHIQRNSLEQLKEEISPKHFQIFQLLDIQHKKVKDVAKLFKLPEQTIYSIRNRTEEKLKEIARNLDI